MTTLGYLILITVLSLFAAAIIYVWMRQHSRSHGAAHHDPGPISFEPSAISTAEEAEIDYETISQKMEVRIDTPESGHSPSNETSEYLDELQDAAAGLARLMHSSHSDRAVLPNVVEGDSRFIVEEEQEEEISTDLPDREVVFSNEIESVLGEEVVDQIDRIDSELDALEELVASIEESLEAFSALDVEEDDAAGEETERSASMAEAA